VIINGICTTSKPTLGKQKIYFGFGEKEEELIYKMNLAK